MRVRRRERAATTLRSHFFFLASFFQVDSFALSRRKTRSLARDFADACLLAEVLDQLWPGLVNVRGYR